MVGSRSRSSVIGVLGLVTVLIVSACSGDDNAESTATTAAGTAFDADNAQDQPDPDLDLDLAIDDDVIIATDDGAIPPTTTDPAIDETPDAPPQPDATTTTAVPVETPEPVEIGRIVSMSPTHTETLFALGLGEFVVAVDNESDYPEAALAVRRDDLAADSADIGAVLALDPDIVLVGEDLTGFVGRLDAAGVASYTGPPAQSLDDVFTQIRDIAALVGRPDLADDLVARMAGEIDAIVASLPDAGEMPLTFFHEIDPSLFTIGTDNFLDDIYGELGLVNIVDADDEVTQVTAEFVVASDPSVILLADAECCAVTIDVVAQRPGWAGLSAVGAGAVVPVGEALTSRWGPRVVDLIRVVAGGVVAAAG